jgi:hypothetical protein
MRPSGAGSVASLLHLFTALQIAQQAQRAFRVVQRQIRSLAGSETVGKSQSHGDPLSICSQK